MPAALTDSELGRISKPFQKMEVQKTFFVCLKTKYTTNSTGISKLKFSFKELT